MSALLPSGVYNAGPYRNGIQCTACNDGFHCKPSLYSYAKPGETVLDPLTCRSCGNRRWHLNVPGRRLNVFTWWHPLTWFAKRSWQWVDATPPPPPPPPPSEPTPDPDPDPATSLPVNAPEWLKV